MDIGKSVSERLAREPGLLWKVIELGEAKASATCLVERSVVSLAYFLAPTAEDWTRFARETRPAQGRDCVRALAVEYVRASGWRMEGALSALNDKAPGLEKEVAKLWGELWEGVDPDSRKAEMESLGELELSVLGRGLVNTLAERASRLMMGIGRAEELNMGWVSASEGAAKTLRDKFGPGDEHEAWGRVVATLLLNHMDYGKTLAWAASGVWEALAGPGHSGPIRRKEMAVKGFEDHIRDHSAELPPAHKERLKSLLSSIEDKMEPLRLGAHLPEASELPRGRGPRKA